MARQRITLTEDGATLLITPDVLNALGLHPGDEVDVAVGDHAVLIRSLDEAERAERIDRVTESVLARRKKVLMRLSDEPTR